MNKEFEQWKEENKEHLIEKFLDVHNFDEYLKEIWERQKPKKRKAVLLEVDPQERKIVFQYVDTGEEVTVVDYELVSATSGLEPGGNPPEMTFTAKHIDTWNNKGNLGPEYYEQIGDRVTKKLTEGDWAYKIRKLPTNSSAERFGWEINNEFYHSVGVMIILSANDFPTHEQASINLKSFIEINDLSAYDARIG